MTQATHPLTSVPSVKLQQKPLLVSDTMHSHTQGLHSCAG